jgi:hypothetical protein
LTTGDEFFKTGKNRSIADRAPMGQRMTREELHQLLLTKWGRSYDLQLRRLKGKIYLQVMWKYLEQASFPLSEREYLEHLNAVANYLNGWGVEAQVRAYVEQTRERPRLGKAVSIPLDLGDRASEWIVDDI